MFLDGRFGFFDHEETVPLAELVTASATTGSPLRFIMHMSFCGSTQVAHLLDASGAATVLKEPQALIDLADWRRAMVEQQVGDDWFIPCLGVAAGLLSRRWDEAPPTVLKPSNWANNLIPDLLTMTDARVLLVRIDARPFLRAVFRGGRDRMAYTARAATHLADAFGQAKLIEDAIASSEDPLDRIARIALAIHVLQDEAFARALEQAPNRCGSIDFVELASDPAGALGRAAMTLGLDLPARGTEAAVDRRSKVDSKTPGLAFHPSDQEREDQVVESHHGDRFDRAMVWAKSSLPGSR